MTCALCLKENYPHKYKKNNLFFWNAEHPTELFIEAIPLNTLARLPKCVYDEEKCENYVENFFIKEEYSVWKYTLLLPVHEEVNKIWTCIIKEYDFILWINFNHVLGLYYFLPLV